MIIACDFSWLFSWKDYWYAGISAVIGTLLGIAWANFQMQQHLQKQTEKNKMLLKEAIDFNIARLDQIVDYINNKNLVPNFSLDADTLSKRIDANVDNYDKQLISDLSWRRYQLEHINNKISFINGGPTTTTGIVVEQRRLDDLEYHAALISKELTDLKGRI